MGVALSVYSHPSMLQHDPGPGHPESPDRLAAVLGALESLPGLSPLAEAMPAAREDLLQIHPAAYVDHVFNSAPQEGRVPLDPDTWMSPMSLDAALRACGAVTDAVRAVARGEIDRAFCAVRPPGHHAEPERANGFCLFSSLAVAAAVARAEGFRRVAIVDFDVHHANGTQAALQDDPDLFVGSIHQMPLFPGTGRAEESGGGSWVNVPVAPHTAREAWRQAFEAGILGPLDAFAPDLILVSAGFDAHRRDPLAHQSLETEDFAWATRAILGVARRHCRGRLVSSLEGGYDLQALGQSARAHVTALQEV